MKVVDHLQDRVARLIGVSPADRVSVLEGMLARSTADAVGYWLQLVLSMAIATFGLAMNSTAVVIGAMLISPLMQPLIELGMGLATGSLLLSIRAGVRTAASIAGVVLGAAGLTQLLPFHEITAELAARASPTTIDLYIAVACAFAAVYTTVRQGKDVVSTAAGTAIGISLVPPLCAAGYGLGASRPELFRGALLLFTANFAAITAVTAITVLLLGFGQTRVSELEDGVLASPTQRRLSHRAARLTRRAMGRRLGLLTRLLFPAILLGAIIVPLTRALEEVSWQARVRAAVADILAKVPGDVVRQALEVRNGSVHVRLFLVGTEVDAQRQAADLRDQIAAVTGHEPVVEVIAVPNAAALDAVASQLRAESAPAPTPPPPTPPAAVTFAAALDAAVAESWPLAAGEILRLRTTHDGEARVTIDVAHLGEPLGAPGVQLLERAWSEALGIETTVRDDAIPPGGVDGDAEDGVGWLARAAELLDRTRDLADLHACVTALPVPAPAPPPVRSHRAPRPPPPSPSTIEPVRRALDQLAALDPRLAIVDGPRWHVEVRREPCAPPPAPEPPATPP